MRGRIILKKIILLILCFVFVFSGCGKLAKAEPYYTETREDVVFSTQYEYSFTDEGSIRCNWKNESKESFSFHDTFELHVLGNDGEWYLVSDGEEVSFNTTYSHGINPESETASRYEVSLYTDELESGKTYRISTYFFDESGNYYQTFAEFTCDDKLAEKEMIETTEGIFNSREEPGYAGELKDKND